MRNFLNKRTKFAQIYNKYLFFCLQNPVPQRLKERFLPQEFTSCFRINRINLISGGGLGTSHFLILR